MRGVGAGAEADDRDGRMVRAGDVGRAAHVVDDGVGLAVAGASAMDLAALRFGVSGPILPPAPFAAPRRDPGLLRDLRRVRLAAQALGGAPFGPTVLGAPPRRRATPRCSHSPPWAWRRPAPTAKGPSSR
jgi:hypothetical protein